MISPAIPLLLAFLATLAPHAKALAPHAQDGPDTDLRVRVQAAAVQLDLYLNLVFVDELVDLPRAREAFLLPHEAQALRSALFERLREVITLQADGRPLAPIDAGFAFLPAEEETLALFPVFGARASARVRVDLSYPFESPPRELALSWSEFPPDRGLPGEPAVEVRALLASGATERLVTLSVDDARVAWRPAEEAAASAPLDVPAPADNTRRLPGLSLALSLTLALALFACFASERGRPARRALLLATPFAIAGAVSAQHIWPLRLPGGGARAPSEAEALAIFAPLLANVYRAFELYGEEEVHDALAASVAGPLLEELYLDVRRTLVLAEAGGAVARVQALEAFETRVESIARIGTEDTLEFAVLVRVRVHASVHHWGHSHERINEQLARYRVRAFADGWRITHCEVLEQQRVDTPPDEQPPDGVIPGARRRRG